MGIFASFSKGFNAGKERAENQSYRRNDLLDCPVELVEPSGKLKVKMFALYFKMKRMRE